MINNEQLKAAISFTRRRCSLQLTATALEIQKAADERDDEKYTQAFVKSMLCAAVLHAFESVQADDDKMLANLLDRLDDLKTEPFISFFV